MSHLTMSAKLPCLFPVFDEKKRKANTLVMKLKITAQLQANVSVLNMFKVG